MSLYKESMEPCQLIEKKRIPDGEGGWNEIWEAGVKFSAAVICDVSMQARKAEKEGVTSIYTVTCEPNAKLEYHDVFRRLRDGKVFRVTSDGDDVQTPQRSTFQFSQVTAEEWELTK